MILEKQKQKEIKFSAKEYFSASSKNKMALKQNISGIELCNSIYNIYFYHFEGNPSFLSFKDKTVDGYDQFVQFLNENGFEKIFSSASSDIRAMYYINKEKEIVIYCHVGARIKIGEYITDAIVKPAYAKEDIFGCSICFSPTEENIEFVDLKFAKFYKELPELVVDEKKATFYMIAQNMNGFKKVSTKCNPKPIKDDNYSMYYGDDFPHDKFYKFMTDDSTDNLVLIYGNPGTGKSNYIKHLVGISTRNVIYIPPSMAASIASPGFIEFMMDNKGSILLIEDAEEILSKDRNAATNNILGITDGFLKDALDLKIICTFNMSRQSLDEALLRKGRLYLEHEFGPLSKNDAQRLADFCDIKLNVEKEMTLAEIFNHDVEVRDEHATFGKPKELKGFAAFV